MPDDLPTRLLSAIAEVEQREALGVHLKLTRPSLLLSVCEAHREIVERHSHPRCRVLPNRATSHRCQTCGWPMPCPDLRSLARGYRLYAEDDGP